MKIPPINRDLLKKDLRRAYTLLTVITNCFIISGVIHHWKPKVRPIYRYTYDNTTMAKHSIAECTRNRNNINSATYS